MSLNYLGMFHFLRIVLLGMFNSCASRFRACMILSVPQSAQTAVHTCFAQSARLAQSWILNNSSINFEKTTSFGWNAGEITLNSI